MKPGRLLMIFCCSLFFLAGISSVSGAAEEEKVDEILLLPPQMEGGKPLMEALAQRRTTRVMREDSISDQDLSNLLWAAWGVNRPDGGFRTVPTARNKQNAALFVAFERGVWRYEAVDNKLVKVSVVDFRPIFHSAPLILIYAGEDAPFSEMHIGSMYQNVGLYCASAGLANVVKQSGLGNLKDAFPLPEGYKIFVIQYVGLPK